MTDLGDIARGTERQTVEVTVENLPFVIVEIRKTWGRGCELERYLVDPTGAAIIDTSWETKHNPSDAERKERHQLRLKRAELNAIERTARAA